MRTKWKDQAAGYLFIAPLLIIFAVFLAYSFFFLIKTSFFYEDISFRNAEYIGLDNYRQVLGDNRFLFSIVNTLAFSAAAILISITVGFITAVFLNFKFKGSRFIGALFFIPSFMPLALIAMVFSMMLEYRFGTLNQALSSIGLDFLAQRWLSDPQLAFVSVISISIFLIGLPMMYYNADLTTVNPSLLEAAVIDGASMPRILWNILFPLLKNAHKTIILSTILGSFREFERVFLLTQGGPAGTTENTSVYIYSFARSAGSNIGFVSAASVVVLLIAFGISLIQLFVYKPKRERRKAA